MNPIEFFRDPEVLIGLFLAHPVLVLCAVIALLVALGLAGYALALSRGSRAAADVAPPPEAVSSGQPLAAPAQPVEAGAASTIPVAAAPPPEVVEEKPRLASLRERLAKTSTLLIGGLERALGGRKLEGEVLEEIEDLLFTADFGVKTADSLLETVRERAAGKDAAAVREVLAGAILQKLEAVEAKHVPAIPEGGDGPHVILVLGVNGAGKTTTIGKLAARYTREGKRVILGAGDTFRAAAIEQLQIWGERVGCEVIVGVEGGDPASVAFDAVKAGIARDADIVIVDTAGRLQTKQPLMEELSKIVRVIGRELPSAPHETLLVLDANTGQNALSQARVFTEAAGVTGLVLTKLDGTAKGGVLVGLADEFGIPVRYIGVGEAVDDLRGFSAKAFVVALFGQESFS